MLMKAGVAMAALAMALAAMAGRAGAEPLPQEDCEKLQAEQNALAASGVREQFERGAAWGKTSLSAAQLSGIERFITLEEQLSFRCGLAKLRASLPDAEEGGEQELDEKGKPVPAKPKPGASTGQTKGKPKQSPPAGRGEAGPGGTKAASKAKPKVDDAYRPPSRVDPAADPFAKRLPDQKK